MTGVDLTATYSGSLAAGASVSFIITGTLTGSVGGTVTNTATVSTGDTDPNLSNNSDTGTTFSQIKNIVNKDCL